ncbi:MAG: hypothetical protein JXB34_03710 [Bacteroidales bacterium]|nr:hypothetical protein [Bacteroidales bacterium]
MPFATSYLEKHQKIKFEVTEAPQGLLCYIVIIPAYREPDVLSTLLSIKNSKPVDANIEVYVLFNYPEGESAETKNEAGLQYAQTSEWCNTNSTSSLLFKAFLAPDLPQKHAGVGLARKILMDLAVERFNNINNPNGIILSLDADTLVPDNYFTGLHKRNTESPATNCFLFNFEHATSGFAYPANVYAAATLYELHLRYYKQILESTGFPYYYYTIGSAFAVRASVYVKSGGMNKRKAGEDFYFLQKIYMHDNIRFLPEIILKPSSRISDRVPFGTGAAITKIVGGANSTYSTYHPGLFFMLKDFFSLLPLFYTMKPEEIGNKCMGLPPVLCRFLETNNYLFNINEIKQNTASLPSFIKRFYQWFDAFKVIKFLNYARENGSYNIDVCTAVNLYLGNGNELNASELLRALRDVDRGDHAYRGSC